MHRIAPPTHAPMPQQQSAQARRANAPPTVQAAAPAPHGHRAHDHGDCPDDLRSQQSRSRDAAPFVATPPSSTDPHILALASAAQSHHGPPYPRQTVRRPFPLDHATADDGLALQPSGIDMNGSHALSGHHVSHHLRPLSRLSEYHGYHHEHHEHHERHDPLPHGTHHYPRPQSELGPTQAQVQRVTSLSSHNSSTSPTAPIPTAASLHHHYPRHEVSADSHHHLRRRSDFDLQQQHLHHHQDAALSTQYPMHSYDPTMGPPPVAHATHPPRAHADEPPPSSLRSRHLNAVPAAVMQSIGHTSALDAVPQAQHSPPPLRKARSDPHMMPGGRPIVFGREPHSEATRPLDYSQLEAPREHLASRVWRNEPSNLRERDVYVNHREQQLLQEQRPTREWYQPHQTGYRTQEALAMGSSPGVHEDHAECGRQEPPPASWQQGRSPPDSSDVETASGRIFLPSRRHQLKLDQQKMQSFRLQRAGLVSAPHQQQPASNVRQPPSNLSDMAAPTSTSRRPPPPPPIFPPPPPHGHLLPVSPDASHFMDALKIQSPTAYTNSASPLSTRHQQQPRVPVSSTSPQAVQARRVSCESIDQGHGAGSKADVDMVCLYPEYLALTPSGGGGNRSGGRSASRSESSFGQQLRDHSDSVPQRSYHPQQQQQQQLLSQPKQSQLDSNVDLARSSAPATSGTAQPGDHSSKPATWSHSAAAHVARNAEFHHAQMTKSMNRPRSTPDMGTEFRGGYQQQQQQQRESVGAAGISRTLRGRSSMSNLSGPLGTAMAAATGGNPRTANSAAAVGSPSQPVGSGSDEHMGQGDEGLGGDSAPAKSTRKSIRGLISALKSTLHKVKNKETSSDSPAILRVSMSTSVSPLVSPTASAARSSYALNEASRASGNRYAALSAAEVLRSPTSLATPANGHIVQTTGPGGVRPLTSVVFSLPIPGTRRRAMSASAPSPPRRNGDLVSPHGASAGRSDGDDGREVGGRKSSTEMEQRRSHDAHATATVLAAEMVARSTTQLSANPVQHSDVQGQAHFMDPSPLPAFPLAVTMSLDRPLSVAINQQPRPAMDLQQSRVTTNGPDPRARPPLSMQGGQQQQRVSGSSSIDIPSVSNVLGMPTSPPFSTTEIEALMSDPVLLEAFLGTQAFPDVGVPLSLDTTTLNPLLLNQPNNDPPKTNRGDASNDSTMERIPTPHIPVLVSPDISAAWSRSPFARISAQRESSSVLDSARMPAMDSGVLGSNLTADAGGDTSTQAGVTAPVRSRNTVGLCDSAAAGVPLAEYSTMSTASNQQHQQTQLYHQAQLAACALFQQAPMQTQQGLPFPLFGNPGLYSPATTNPSPNHPQLGQFPNYTHVMAPQPPTGTTLQAASTGRGGGPVPLPPNSLTLSAPSAAPLFLAVSPMSPISDVWPGFHSSHASMVVPTSHGGSVGESQRPLYDNVPAEQQQQPARGQQG